MEENGLALIPLRRKLRYSMATDIPRSLIPMEVLTVRTPTASDIVIRLQLRGGETVDVKELIRALDNLEIALYHSDRDDILQAAFEIRLPPVARDAALERLRSFRHKRLQVLEARPGSLTVVAVVTAVGIYVLEKAVGEAYKDAFKDTVVYRQLREFFRRQIDAKALAIAEGVRRLFASKKRNVSVKALPPSAETRAPHVIEVDVAPEEKPEQERVGTLGETLDK